MRKIIARHMEVAIILLFLGIFVLIKLVLANKFAFLNLYFIPVLLAGYYLGRRPAIMSSLLGALLAILFVVSWPAEIRAPGAGSLSFGLDLLVWASFLMLVAILVSTLNEGRRQRVAAATQELLHQYIKRSFEVGDSHTRRVSHLAVATARHLHISGDLLKQIEAAALLHDIGENELAIELLSVASLRQPDQAQQLIAAAAPMVVAGHQYRVAGGSEDGVSIGAKIIAVVDLYDEVAQESKNIQPWWESIEQIKCGGRFDSAVIAALRKALTKEPPQSPQATAESR